MKVAFLGLDITPGKVKYQDPKFQELVIKFEPQKETPFFIELAKEDFATADAVLVAADKLLDFLILDMEKLENRRDATQDPKEKALIIKCLTALEKEVPLCQLEFNEEEQVLLRGLAPYSLNPTVIADKTAPLNTLIEQALKTSATAFFYTCGKKEVHAWPFKLGMDIVTCAGKIHSDLARGFIRAEIVNYDDLMQVHNYQEAKDKGLVKLVGRDYITKDGDIIEIKFNV